MMHNLFCIGEIRIDLFPFFIIEKWKTALSLMIAQWLSQKSDYRSDRLQAHGMSASAAPCWGCLCFGWRSGRGRWTSSPFSSVCRKLRKIFSDAWGAQSMEVSC